MFEDPAWYEPDLNAQRRKIEGNRRFNKTQRRTLQRLVEQRDAIARAENLPPRSVMPDAVVLQVARDRPSKADTLAAMRGMPAQLAHKHADAFLAMLDDDAVTWCSMTEPSIEELQDSINELSAYRERLENDVKAMGQKLRMPQKKIQSAIAEHAELQRLGEILNQLTTQRDAIATDS